ncbi:MAG: ABC transporter permease [Thermoanaerobaculia bacterium]|nr:ABC transporter permease [Thermoanaerobaculia bacterium]
MSTGSRVKNPAMWFVPSRRENRRDIFRILRLETRMEMLKLLRAPSFVVPTFSFPILFYVLFGLLLADKMSSGSATGASAYLLVSYSAFGVIGAHLFALGVGVAGEKGMGWMRLKRASPMPPLAHFFARILVALAFGAALVLIMFALGAAFGGVRLTQATWLGLGLWLILGGIPFSALGLALGHLLGPNSAPATLNLIYLPISFASGLWMPIWFLPEWLQTAAQALPPFHLGVQGHAMIGAANEAPPLVTSALVLAVFTGLSLLLAVTAWRREETE